MKALIIFLKMLGLLVWSYISVFIPKQFKASLAQIAFLLACYELLRLGFLIANARFFTGVPFSEISLSFYHGLRFDISALLMINGILLVLYNFPGHLTRWKWFRYPLLGLFWLANLLFIGLNISDYVYFPTIERRLMSEIYTILPDILRMMPSMLTEYFYLVILILAGGAFFIWATLKIFKKIESSAPYRFAPVREGFFLVLICAFVFLGIRGGLQSRPVRPAHAFFSPNRIVGHLTLNSSFTILRSISQASLTQYSLMPKEEARKIIEEMVRQPDETMLDAQYPFLRRKTVVPPGQNKYNLVLFIMESWTGDYVGSVSGANPSSTPFFDSIAGEGILFTNFLANGQRSIIAETSIISSIPGVFSTSIDGAKKVMINSQSESNRFIGLGTVMLKEGYYTSFHHGAKKGSMGFDAYSRLAGFSDYFAKEDYPDINSRTEDGTWGIWDEEFFLDSLRHFNEFKQPFCSAIFSLTSHDPFRIPEHRAGLFAAYATESKFQRVLRYSDYSLKQFFEGARNQPWFKDTIFIITGDHTNYARPNNMHSHYNIPFLIYAPGIVMPQKIGRIGSQVDILPTVLDLMGISTIHASMGRSLFDAAQTHYAVITEGSYCVIFDDQYALMNDLGKTLGMYDYRLDPALKDDLQLKQPDAAARLKKNLLAYIQEVTYSIAQDKICRDSDIKNK